MKLKELFFFLDIFKISYYQLNFNKNIISNIVGSLYSIFMLSFTIYIAIFKLINSENEYYFN
jgi:hypothetical protein